MALTAYRFAFTEHTRVRVPLDWAMTQSNLSSALLSLGKREGGTARLEEARIAIQLAQEVYWEFDMREEFSWLDARLRAVDRLIASRS